MCDCTEQFNAVGAQLTAMSEQLNAMSAVVNSISDDTAETQTFVTEMGLVMDQFKTLFSEDNIMGMLGGFMGGGMPPSIGG